ICLPPLAREEKACLTEASSSETNQREFLCTGKTRSIALSQTGSKPTTRTSRARIVSKYFLIPCTTSSRKSRLIMLYDPDDRSPNVLIILQDCRASEKRNASRDAPLGLGRKTLKSCGSFIPSSFNASSR